MKASVEAVVGSQTSVVLVDWCASHVEEITPQLRALRLAVHCCAREQFLQETFSRDSVCGIFVHTPPERLDEIVLARVAHCCGHGIPVVLLVEAEIIAEVFGMEELPYAELLPSDTSIGLLLRKAVLFAELHWQWQALSQQDREIAALLSIFPEALFLLDRHGRVKEYHPRAGVRLFTETGQEKTRPVGQVFGKNAVAPLMGALEQVLASTASGKNKAYRVVDILGELREVWLTRFAPDQALLMVRNSGVAMPPPESDANDMAQLKEELAAARETIGTLVASGATKHRYFTHASHEFRAPLNGVLGMAELLGGTSLDEEQREYVDVIKLSGEALLTAANDILDFSKLEAGGMVLERVRFDLRRSIEGVFAMVRHQAEERGIELVLMVHHNVPRYGVGDPGRLRQVLLNLVSNALKFTAAGEIGVEVKAGQFEPDSLCLSVSVTDTGKGIVADELARVFEPYVQAEVAGQGAQVGTGLGLAICRELVSAMGGTIGVESTLGKGSRFYFDVRLGVAEEETKPELSPVYPLTGRPILVVGDGRQCAGLEAMLVAQGCRATVLPGGRNVIRNMKAAAAKGKPYHAVIFYYDFPGPDGIALGKQIRSDTSLEKVKLVLLTSTPFRGDGQYVGAAGFDAYLPLPVSDTDLRNCLGSVLKQSHEPLQTRHLWEEHIAETSRILLVDDSPVNQRVVVRMIARLGFRCDVAYNGKECLEALSSTAYDLVFMDCQMPVLNGFEATRVIREREGTGAAIPIVALTAGGMASDRDDCLAAGMTDYLAKPIRMEQLRDVLGRYLGAALPE